MKKIKTLKMNYEFKNVFTKGKFFYNNQIIIYILKNNLQYNRIGVAVGAKTCNAVKRNRIKRVIREGYRNFDNNIEKSYDIVFLWNKKMDPKEVSYKIIVQEMEKSFKKAGIIY